jgi:CRP/FNR family transcriptional regulator, anaerobic regulatory protein
MKTTAKSEVTSAVTIPICDLGALKAACATCNLRELCLPAGVSAEELDSLDELVYVRRKLKRGEALFRERQDFDSIYAVRTGFFKTRVTTEDGRDHVTGFSMAGEILGLDGISHGSHSCDAIAIEDSEVCSIPYTRLEQLSQQLPSLQRHFHKVMSREIVRENGVLLLLGVMRAEERVAAFLLNLSQRLNARGYSATDFHLRMTRDEIGSYLGMKLETVSRVFSRFHSEGLLEVEQKHIRLRDAEGLRRKYGCISNEHP